MGGVVARKIIVEVEVPEGVEEETVRDMVERLVAYLLLEEKARSTLDNDEIDALVREARKRVGGRIKPAPQGLEPLI